MATYTINVTINPPATGTLKIGSELVNGNVQEEGVTVNILAGASSGYRFLTYVIDGGAPITTRAYSFVMPSSDVNIIVNFELIPVPTEEEQDSLYDTSCPKFFFIENLTDRFFAGDVIELTGYTYTELSEPIDFDSGTFKLERDEMYHGFNYEFATDALKYESESVGYSYLKNKLLTEGTDTDIKFLYGFGQPEAFTVFYLGKVDMNEYKETNNGDLVEFNLVELDFDNLLQTAFDVEQSTAPDLDVLLYSKVIPKKVSYLPAKNDQIITTESDLYPKMFYNGIYVNIWNSQGIIGDNVYIFVNDGREGDDIETFTTYDFHLDKKDPKTEGAGRKYLLKAKQAGSYKLDVKTVFRMFLDEVTAFQTFDPTYSFLKLEIIRTGEDGEIAVSTVTENRSEVLNTPTTDNYVDLKFDYSYTYDLKLNDCLYLYFTINTTEDLPIFVDTNASISEVYLLPFEGNSNQAVLTITAETLEKASKSKFISPLPLLESIISKSAETDYTTVVSDFFDVGGCGNKLVLSNGFNVRGLTPTDLTAIKISAKKLVDSMVNLFCLGWGVEYDIFKQEVIRIEPVEHFYQDVEILSFTDVSDYTKEIDSSKYYNEIEIGFRNYSKDREKDKGNTIDDFHTKHSYQTPIKTNKNKKSIVTDLTLSGYEIEILRRKQFEREGTDENANFREDENLFGVQLLDYTLFTGGTYTGLLTDLTDGEIINITTSQVIILGYVYFYNGQLLDVNVDSQGNKRTSILNIQYKLVVPTGFPFPVMSTIINFTVPIDPDINPFSPTITLSTVNGESYYVPEADQSMIVSNVISPQTCYNLRYSPKRMLYNWAKLFNGGFFGKLATDTINFKQGDGNVSLSTEFYVEEACALGDLDRDTIVENANVAIGDIYNRGFLMLPIKVSFSTNLSFEQLTDLKRCLRGQDGVRDYGYLTIINSCGETEKIYPTSIEYSPVTEESTIEGWLKEF